MEFASTVIFKYTGIENCLCILLLKGLQSISLVFLTACFLEGLCGGTN